jgi:hypothetical protein
MVVTRREIIKTFAVAGAHTLLVACEGPTSPTAKEPFPGTPFDPKRTVSTVYDGTSTISNRVQFVDMMRRQFAYNPRTTPTVYGNEIVELVSPATRYNPREMNPDFGFVFSLRNVHFDTNAFDPRLEVSPGDRVTIYVSRRA